MFFIGAILKPFRRRKEAKKRLELLDEAIGQAEREQRKPLLEGLSGVERFESAAALLDSTLLARIAGEPRAEARRAFTDTYFTRLNEEYQMAKSDLQATPASRAEVVALGLAVKEIALSLDQEIDTFRASGATALAEVAEIPQKLESEGGRLEGMITAAVDGLRSRVDESAEEARHASRQLARSVTEARLESERRAQAVEARLESTASQQETALTRLSSRVDERIATLAAELSKRIDVARHEQERLLQALKAEQEDAMRVLTESTEELRRWLYVTAGVAAVALIVGLTVAVILVQ